MKKENLFGILSGVFCASLIISNILAFKTFTIGEFVLPTAVILFPIVYITNDILSEIFGYKKTKQVVITGFVMNIIAVIGYNVAIMLPAPSFFTGQEAFSLVLSNTFRVLVASMSAYMVGSLVNAKVMEVLKNKFENKLMFRCVTSTLIGEGLDALIFITIAFLGTMPFTSLLTMVVCQATFKTLYEVVCYPATRKLIYKTREMK
ncbi:MAG: queuosine precursor transporter [Treponema sp.]|nr:queuosine precursor transporter [Treponema sp.]